MAHCGLGLLVRAYRGRRGDSSPQMARVRYPGAFERGSGKESKAKVRSGGASSTRSSRRSTPLRSPSFGSPSRDYADVCWLLGERLDRALLHSPRVLLQVTASSFASLQSPVAYARLGERGNLESMVLVSGSKVTAALMIAKGAWMDLHRPSPPSHFPAAAQCGLRLDRKVGSASVRCAGSHTGIDTTLA
jgi:hypothetical protein